MTKTIIMNDLQIVNQGGVVYSHTLINTKDTKMNWR